MKAPFDTDCNLMHYPETRYEWDAENQRSIPCEPEWREFGPVRMVLRLEDMRRGRSAAYFMFVNEITGCRYPMFMKDLMDTLKHATMSAGLLPGTFEVCKRGQNYGIRRVGP